MPPQRHHGSAIRWATGIQSPFTLPSNLRKLPLPTH